MKLDSAELSALKGLLGHSRKPNDPSLYQRLVEAGLVAERGDGFYGLTPKGFDRAKQKPEPSEPALTGNEVWESLADDLDIF